MAPTTCLSVLLSADRFTLVIMLGIISSRITFLLPKILIFRLHESGIRAHDNAIMYSAHWSRMLSSYNG